MADVAGQIDALLSKRGSPMAGLGNVFVATAKKYGVDPRLVVSISGIESGFGKHLLGGYNAWGWGPGHSFGSYAEGISTVTRGLRDGYYSRGLKTPEQIAGRYAPASDGNDEGNWAKTVSGFMSDLGGMVPSSTRVGGTPSTTGGSGVLPPPSSSGLRQAALSNLSNIALRGGHADPLGMLSSIAQGVSFDRSVDQQNRQQAVSPVPSSTSQKSGSASFPASGEPVPARYLSSIGGEHPTSGLAGYPAKDFMARSGSPVVAPVGGTIIRLSGHPPAQGPTQGPHGPFGWSLYLKGNDGHTYYLTHLGSRSVKVGQTVRGGQAIGTVGDYAKYGTPSHVHMGVH